ncbi:MAG: high-affinity nickel-transport family protein [Candidatus Rokubacteria bacterium]|nr:high-affinity nickel-transport family protein [Candidatus Rokubacteria bacterium]
MDSSLGAIALGFVFGLQHATDADHVVAVASIVSRTGRFGSGALVGAFWGLGHTVTIAAVGLAIVLFNVTVTPRTGLSMELAVAFMLMALGVARIARLMRDRDERPGQPADGHGHDAPRFWLALRTLGPAQAARSTLTGLVHGLAGSAAIALLVLSTVRSPYAAVVYLLVFGLGTIAGMTAITALLSVPFTARLPILLRFRRALALGTGLLSLGFGLYLVVYIGFVDGLLLGR